MAKVVCIGCLAHCILDTVTEEVFEDIPEEKTYGTWCYCPYGKCYVDVDAEDLKKAYAEDYEVLV